MRRIIICGKRVCHRVVYTESDIGKSHSCYILTERHAFSALFGTPITAAVFALEVVHVGVMQYSALVPAVLSSLTGDEQVLLVTGIASPAPLQKEVESYTPHVKLLAFDDHHDFTPKDLLQIKEQFQHLEEWKRLIITTEKDAARLKLHPALDETLKPYIYVLPIEIEILQNQQYIFNQNIIGYVRTYSRNRSLSER